MVLGSPLLQAAQQKEEMSKSQNRGKSCSIFGFILSCGEGGEEQSHSSKNLL